MVTPEVLFDVPTMPLNENQSQGQLPATETKIQGNANESVSKELDRALAMLKKNDNTSRFVGLALLKPVLERKLSHQTTAQSGGARALAQRCWSAIPVKFLDGLLNARPTEQRSKKEAENMTALAVAVMHTFMRLLESPHEDGKFTGRIPTLLSLVNSSQRETKAQILDIVHSVAVTQDGFLTLFSSRDHKVSADTKPSPYLFITMLLIDIRATIPSLQEVLHSEAYLAISARLAKSYDILSAFIGFLGHVIEEMEGSEHSFPSPIPVDLLLKLRVNISETMALTIEYFRDRYDSSTAGAAGLHPPARATSGASPYRPLPIAWDTPQGMLEDPLTLSQLRALSLWLRDEESDLRKEAAGIMDVLLALYQNDDGKYFRDPVCVALSGIIETPEGIEAFLRERGWEILIKELESILSSEREEHIHGEDIVGVLRGVVESDAARPAKEDWMTFLTTANESLTPESLAKDLPLAILIFELAVKIFQEVPRGIRNRNRQRAVDLLRKAESVSTKEDVTDGTKSRLSGVVEGFRSLGLEN